MPVVLSLREREILQFLADGLPITEMATQLGISFASTKTHVANIYEKLGARNRLDALARAVRSDLLPGRPPSGPPSGWTPPD